jgi:RNA polymerase sigma-54 factor
MEFSQSMSMRMGQNQILTPRMIQSMEILQMPVMALEERIDQEMQANPVLEMNLKGDGRKDAVEEFAGSGTENGTLSIDPNSADAKDFQRLEKLADYLENEEFSTNDSNRYRGRIPQEGDRDGKMDALANSAARGTSIGDHLLSQWGLLTKSTPARQGRQVSHQRDRRRRLPPHTHRNAHCRGAVSARCQSDQSRPLAHPNARTDRRRLAQSIRMPPPAARHA